MKLSVSIPLGVSFVIHLLPVPGVLGSQALERLYGIRFQTRSKTDTHTEDATSDADTTDNLVLAMQHRAALFGYLSVGLFTGAFLHRPSLPMAIATTLFSDVSFLALALPRWRRLTAQMKRVVYADIISILCLVVSGSKSVGEK